VIAAISPIKLFSEGREGIFFAKKRRIFRSFVEFKV
jgi:hypothetical protein